MPIINSHYVPLKEPYPIIYYGGTVAMQIGTLIIVNGPGQESGMRGHVFTSRMYTQSHPVVAYGNKYVSEPRGEWRLNMWSEGVVWDYVQLKDVFTLCFTKQKEMSYEALDVLTTSIRLKEAVNGTYKFRLSTVIKDLENMGIERPELLAPLMPAVSLQVSLNKNLAKDLVCVHGYSTLFCCVRLGNDIEEMVTEIRRQIADFLMLFKPNDMEITFITQYPECQYIVDALNNKS